MPVGRVNISMVVLLPSLVRTFECDGYVSYICFLLRCKKDLAIDGVVGFESWRFRRAINNKFYI
jgi:hypothetical protein